jgi:hypothetical protein
MRALHCVAVPPAVVCCAVQFNNEEETGKELDIADEVLAQKNEKVSISPCSKQSTTGDLLLLHFATANLASGPDLGQG